jgi:hypothetical protein
MTLKSAKKPLSEKVLRRFEESKRRKETFAKLRAELGLDGRGFVSGLARELNIDRTRLQKAVAIDKLEERAGDSSYLFSAALARKVEYALLLDYGSLEGDDGGLEDSLSADKKQLVSLAHQHLSELFIDPFIDLKLEYVGQCKIMDGVVPYQVDLRLIEGDKTPLLICNANSSHIMVGSPAWARELGILVMTASMLRVPYVVLATLEGKSRKSKRLHIECRHAVPGAVFESVDIPTVEQLKEAAKCWPDPT